RRVHRPAYPAGSAHPGRGRHDGGDERGHPAAGGRALRPRVAALPRRRAGARAPRARSPGRGPRVIRDLYDAVLLDRDGTLVRNVPYNGDPAAVQLMPGAAAAVARLRALGLKLGVVSNEFGLARGAFTHQQPASVQARIEQLVGPFDTWQICPHDEAAGCSCRKPRPGLVLAAAAALGVAPHRCLVVGDIGSDVAAAQAAGATGVL